jgi:hypothetical protein
MLVTFDTHQRLLPARAERVALLSETAKLDPTVSARRQEVL